MAILTTPSPRGGGAGSQISRHASLLTLCIQNSALILIMHYSRVMPPTSDHRYFTSTAVFLNELIKLAVSLTLAIYETSKTLAPSTPASVLLESIYRNVFAGDGWELGILATLYTLQNLLQYAAVGNLDAVQFQVLYQLKILTTALFSVVLLRRPLGLKRWTALCVLTLGVCVVCIPSETSLPGSQILHDTTDHFFPRSLHELGQASPELYAPQSENHIAKRSATYQGITEDVLPPEPAMNHTLGVTAVLIAAAVSGLTGVYFEKLLKQGPSQSSVWIRNVQLSFYSLITVFFMGIVWRDGEGIREHGFFEGYNWVVWSAVVLQAAGGMIASLVIRDADNIVKNFATSISILLSFLVSVWVFEFKVTWTFVTGTLLVLLSTYLYGTPDRKFSLTGHRPPPVRIVSFEKPAIAPVHTPRLGASPKLNPFDAGKLHVDGNGLGLTSSRPNSPMLPRIPSRGDIRRDD